MQPKIRLLVMTFSVILLSFVNSFSQTTTSATLETDLRDYSPGSVVTLTGAGFGTNEKVTLQVLHVGADPYGSDPEHHQPWVVVADELGGFTATWNVPTSGDALGASFKAVADGQISGFHAETFFTDAITIWSNPIDGTNPGTSANPFTTGQIFNSKITVSGIGMGTGITGNAGNSRYNAKDWTTNSSLDANDYFYFKLTPNSGYHIKFNNFTYTGQTSPSNAPTSFAFRSNANSDNFATNIGSATSGTAGATISLGGSAYQNITSEIEFRFYGWASGGGNGTFSINDFSFSGAVLGTSVTSLTGFSTCVNIASTAQSFTVNGDGLNPNSTITIAPSTNYEVSVTSATTGFQGSGNVTLTADALGSVSGAVWVRLKANATPGTYNNEIINISGGGFASGDNINVTASGSVTGSLAPSASATQTFCSADNPKVSNLQATGTALKWYNSSMTLLNATDAISTGTYYVTQTVSGCQSATTTVSVTVNTATTYYRDADGDGFGDPGVTSQACSAPPGYITDNTDCNDNDAKEHQGQTWYIDADGDGYPASSTTQCARPTNGKVASELISTSTDCNDADATKHAQFQFYVDNDHDGYGTGSLVSVCAVNASTPPTGYASNNTDCDDNDNTKWRTATVYTDADGDGYTVGSSFSVCYGNNLPGGVTATSSGTDCNDADNTKHAQFNFYVDADGDTYGTGSPVSLCAVDGSTPPAGYSVNNTDCNDANANIHPGATEIADNGIDENCDGLDLKTWYQDADGDTYGNPSVSQTANTKPAGYVSDHSDCDDTNAAVHPGAQEVCNGIDDDCDGLIDDADPSTLASSKATFYRDADGDGYGNVAVTILACTAPAGYVSNNTDCNDADATKHAQFQFYVDADHDGYGTGSAVSVCAVDANTPPTGYSVYNTDCNDNDASIHPGATEIADDGIDQDCDGHDLLTWYQDADGDTYGNAAVSQTANTKPAGYVSNHSDCDDTNAAVNPAAQEVCNGIDDDCDGLIDDADPSTLASSKATFYRDADGDGYGNPLVTILACNAPAGYVSNNTDCNDANANIHPGATDIPDNGIDENCDGFDLKTWYRDADGDGYGNPSLTQTANTQPGGYVADKTDCNDSDAKEHPGQTWYIDADGDGYPASSTTQCARPTNGKVASELISTDTDCNDADNTKHAQFQFYVDNDHDGYGTGSLVSVCAVNASTPPTGYASNNTDCNDNDATIAPYPVAPTGSTTQAFFGVHTVADLVATPTQVGGTIKWYETANSITPLSSSTTLIMGHHYFASQTLGSCESVARLEVAVVVTQQEITSINNSVFCAGDQLVINFRTTGAYLGSNVFTGELSNGGGQFGGNSPDLVTISVTPTGTQTVDGVTYNTYQMVTRIPVITTGGGTIDHYRVRVNASAADNGTVNGIFLAGTPYGYDADGFTINPVPDIQNVTGGGDYCTGGVTGVAIGLDDSQTGVNYYLYSYSGNDSTLVAGPVAGTGSAITFGNQPAGVYKVKGVFNNGTGCGVMMAGSATVTASSPLVSGVLTKSPDQASVCEGTLVSASLTTPGSGGPSGTTDIIQYRVDGGSWQPYTTAINTTGHTSVDIKTYRSSSVSGCGESTPYVVNWTVNKPSVAPTQLNVSATPICNGGSTTLTQTGGSLGTGAYWQWYSDAAFTTTVGGHLVSANAQLSVSPTVTTIYYLRAENTTAPCSAIVAASGSVQVVVNQLPAITQQPAVTQTICAGSPVTFTVQATGTSLSYQWYKGSVAPANAVGTNSNSYTINSVTTADAANYYVVVSGTCAPSVTSNASQLIVSQVPLVTTHPQTQTVCLGSPVTFTVAADTRSGGDLHYTWKKGGSAIPGAADQNSYSIPGVALTDAGSYSVDVTNSCGTVTSNAATLTVSQVPLINTPPQSQTICLGSPVTFTVAADTRYGGTLHYVWKKGGNAIVSAADQNSYTINAVALTDAGNYSVTVSNSCGPVSSDIAVLTISQVPSVTTQPQTQTVCLGSNVTFTVAADTRNGGTLHYVWKKGTSVIQGTADQNSYTITGVALADQGNYSVEVTNSCGTASSNAASLTVSQVPLITTQPVASTLLCKDGSVTLSVVADTRYGGTLSYQWKRGTSNVGSNQSTLTLNNIQPADAGDYTVTITNSCGSVTSDVARVMVKEVLVSTNPATNPVSQQYSDEVKFTARIYNGASILTSYPSASVKFQVANIDLNGATNVSLVVEASTTNLIAEITRPLVEVPTNPSNGQMSPGVDKTVKAIFNNMSSGLSSWSACEPTTKLTITQEDARITFTGTQIVATLNSSSSLATVTLRATVQDITATPDASGDVKNGDIRNAKVRFLNNNVPIVISGLTDGNGWVTSGIALVDPSDIKTGIVSLDWPVDIGSQTDMEYTIGIEVSGYYVRNNSSDNTVVTVYKPVGDFITGGGYIMPTQSAGTYPSDPGTRTNFGFNVKYNKSGKSLQGNMNFIFRRAGHTYQIKSNSMTSLGVDITNVAAQKAVFVSKANLTDITNPLAPVSLGGNLTLQVNMTDRGEPGTNDDIAISLYNGSTLLYSSKWTGSSTALMLLSGGNLVVHSGFSLGTVSSGMVVKETIKPVVQQMESEFALAVSPNPSASQFRVQVKSGNKEQKIRLRIIDAAGRVIQIFDNLSAGQVMQIGDKYRPGVYILEFIQGNQRKQIKLVKIPD